MSCPPVVALIGMRGAGKTTLGRGVAEILGFDFDDLDEVITRAANGKLPPQIVAEQGWDAFRKLEADCFQSAASVAAARKGKILACGGGIIETAPAMDIMRCHNPVILIDRHIDDVVATLEADPAAQVHRASLGEHPRDTYKRRLPKYEEVANFRFPIAKGEKDLSSLTTSFARFVNIALGRAIPSTVSDSFFISLTAPDYAQVSPEILRSAASNADTLEFRVDLLESLEPENVIHQAALIRRSAPGTPLLFTVRSVDHGGKFAGSEDEYFKLNFLGLQLCAELLDVECTWSESRIADLVAKRGPSLLVGSYHNFGRMLNRTELKDVFQRCMLSGAAAIAKVVVKAEAREDNWTVQEVGKATTPDSAAFIGLCLGEAGKLSRILNQVMCPSMHPSLAPGAPGQMSVTELLETRQALGLMGTSRQFAVIGPWEGEAPKTSAAASLSLRLLQAAFKALRLPHVAVQDFARSSEEASRLLALASTGGAVLLGPLTSQLASEAWADVSYVDCVVQRNGKLTGHCCKSERLKERLQPLGSKRTAAILGERGDPAACVAGLHAVGFQRIVTATPCEEPDVEVVQDLSKVKDLDALIYMGMEMPLEKLQQSLTEICQSNKPMVIDMSLQMGEAPTWLSELAKKSDCQMVSSEVFLLEEMLAWFRAWHIEAKADVLKEVVAKELVNFREASQQARQAWT